MSEGLSQDCPTIWDAALNDTRPDSMCRKRLGVVTDAHCDIKNQVGMDVKQGGGCRGDACPACCRGTGDWRARARRDARRRRRLPHLPPLRLALGQGWCRPGVVSYRRFDGPIILPYGAASVMNRWAQMYDAMTTDVRCAWSAPACVAGWWWWRRCVGWQSC